MSHFDCAPDGACANLSATGIARLLTIYLAAVAFGGTLLGASIVLGGKDTDHGGGDAGHDTDASHDTDGSHEANGGHHTGLGDTAGWFPVGSLRFWTFLLAFGGAVGALLTLLGIPGSALAVGAAALGTGWVSGVGATAAVRALAARSTDSMTSAGELVGSTGQLLLGAGPDEPGKVRLEVKGRVQDFVAISEDETLPTGSSVMVVSSTGGKLVVTKNDDG